MQNMHLHYLTMKYSKETFTICSPSQLLLNLKCKSNSTSVVTAVCVLHQSPRNHDAHASR